MIYIASVIGLIFLRSGYSKLAGGKFVGGLSKTLGSFASENPYPPVKAFLINVAIPNSTVFGLLTMLGEIYAGLSITSAVIYFLFKKSLNKLFLAILISGLIVNIFLNATFYFAAGWTSPSTETVNLVMLLIGLISFVYAIKKISKVSKS